MLKELPDHTTATEIPHFEHLDFLWGENVDELVFPHVLNALEKYSAPDLLPSSFSSGSRIAFGQLDLDADLLPESAVRRVSDQQTKEAEDSLEAAVLARLAQNAATAQQGSNESSTLRHRPNGYNRFRSPSPTNAPFAPNAQDGVKEHPVERLRDDDLLDSRSASDTVVSEE